MRSLAAFVMKGRGQAILVAALAALVPLLMWLSGAVLALVTLRRGVREGLLVLAGTTVVPALLLTFSGAPQQVLAPLLELWLPVLLVAWWLRVSVSLRQALQLCAALGALAVTGFYLLLPEPAAYWGAQFAQVERVLGPEAAGAPELVQLRAQLLPLMTGLWASSLMLLVIGSLLLGRWWQALLYLPGGFRQEFHGLRLDPRLAVVALVLWIASAFTGPGLINDLGLVLGGIFVLQGLSLVHAVVGGRGWSGAWLVPVYGLLPFAFQLVMAAGLADALFNWRRRLLSI